MTEEYKAKVRAWADYFYKQGYPVVECIRMAEAALQMPELIEFARTL